MLLFGALWRWQSHQVTPKIKFLHGPYSNITWFCLLLFLPFRFCARVTGASASASGGEASPVEAMPSGCSTTPTNNTGSLPFLQHLRSGWGRGSQGHTALRDLCTARSLRSLSVVRLFFFLLLCLCARTVNVWEFWSKSFKKILKRIIEQTEWLVLLCDLSWSLIVHALREAFPGWADLMSWFIFGFGFILAAFSFALFECRCKSLNIDCGRLSNEKATWTIQKGDKNSSSSSSKHTNPQPQKNHQPFFPKSRHEISTSAMHPKPPFSVPNIRLGDACVSGSNVQRSASEESSTVKMDQTTGTCLMMAVGHPTVVSVVVVFKGLSWVFAWVRGFLPMAHGHICSDFWDLDNRTCHRKIDSKVIQP